METGDQDRSNLQRSRGPVLFSGSCDFGLVFSLFFHVLRAASWILFYGNGGAQARVFGCFLRGLTIHVGSASSGGTCGAGHGSGAAWETRSELGRHDAKKSENPLKGEGQLFASV